MNMMVPPHGPQMPQTGLPPEVLAMADQIFVQMEQQLAPLLQLFQAAGQLVQQKTPQAPLDPAITAQLQIAQMEVQRKTQLDQATLALKQQEMQLDQQVESSHLQMEQMQQRFDNFMAQQQQTLDVQSDQLTQQVELMKNDEDNRQHQATELLKNHEDNRTNLVLEQMRQRGLSSRHELEQGFKNQQSKLDTLMTAVVGLQTAKQNTENSATSTSNQSLDKLMESMSKLVEAMNRPKEIVRDAQGRATGVK